MTLLTSSLPSAAASRFLSLTRRKKEAARKENGVRSCVLLASFSIACWLAN